MTAQGSQTKEHYPTKHESTIKDAIASISAMEKEIDELASQVSDMKKKLVAFAESKADQAKALVIEQANNEAQAYLDSVRKEAQTEAQKIIENGNKDTEALKKRTSGSVSSAVDLIVRSVLSV